MRGPKVSKLHWKILMSGIGFLGNEFHSPEPKTARFAHIYRWQGVTPIDRDRFVSAE